MEQIAAAAESTAVSGEMLYRVEEVHHEAT
jgi:hypothetical protein